jgi:hypothetical protein
VVTMIVIANHALDLNLVFHLLTDAPNCSTYHIGTDSPATDSSRLAGAHRLEHSRDGFIQARLEISVRVAHSPAAQLRCLFATFTAAAADSSNYSRWQRRSPR